MTLNRDDLEAKAQALAYRGGDEQVLALDTITLIARLREAENGLFRVVQALGFDTDGAKNAKEFFGPLTYFKGQEQYTEPWDIAVRYAEEFRAEVERDADELEDRLYKYQDEAVKAWGRALNAEDVISEALNHDPLHGSKEGLHCGGMAPCIRETLTAHEPWNYEK